MKKRQHGRWPLANQKAFTLVELMVSVVLAVVMAIAAYGAVVTAQRISEAGSAEQDLQLTANTIMNKIVKGNLEPSGFVRLSEAATYDTSNGISDFRFTIGTDTTIRRYYLSADGRQILYNHPSSTGAVQDEVIYTAPANTVITLRFYAPTPVVLPAQGGPGDVYNGVVIAIDVGLSTNVRGRTINGSASTWVNLRNHP